MGYDQKTTVPSSSGSPASSGSSVWIWLVVFAAGGFALAVVLVVVAAATSLYLFRSAQSRDNYVREVVVRNQIQADRAKLRARPGSAQAVYDQMHSDLLKRAEAIRDAETAATPRTLAVRVDADGGIHSEGQSLSREQFESRLKEDSDPDSLAVVFHVDPDCKYEKLVALMTLCQTAGISEIRVDNEESPEENGD